MNERHPIRVWTGQFNIIDGDVREEGANVATFEGRPSNGEIPALYIVAEPAVPESEGMVGQMVQAIGQLFARQEVSLTGNLLRALRGAHESLFRWNLQQGGSVARSSAGCSAAVVLGSDVYLAQCGPAVAYYLGAGGFERISPGPAASIPIGVAEALRPSLTHYTLEPGDALLLARSTLASLAPEDQIATLMALSPEDALPELYLTAKAQENFSVLLLAAVPATAAAAPAPSAARSGATPSQRNPFGR